MLDGGHNCHHPTEEKLINNGDEPEMEEEPSLHCHCHCGVSGPAPTFDRKRQIRREEKQVTQR